MRVYSIFRVIVYVIIAQY